jgi:hypothetical protein
VPYTPKAGTVVAGTVVVGTVMAGTVMEVAIAMELELETMLGQDRGLVCIHKPRVGIKIEISRKTQL